MIDRASITQWAGRVPWNDPAQVEQDLIISRALYQRKKGRDLFDLHKAKQAPVWAPAFCMRVNRRLFGALQFA